MEANTVKEIRIKKINIIQNEDVYDIKVKKNHNFFANNLLIHNCGEQPLPVGGACLLGSLNLTQFINTTEDNWDYDRLKEVIPIIVRLMDNINDISYVPLERQKFNLINKRRIGLGIMGYASALIIMKKKYGSKEVLKMTEELMSFIMNTAYQSSALLAKEKGSFALFDVEKYLKGNFIKGLSKETKTLIKENGIRNSHLLTIAPTGNTASLANNVSGGLEPVFSLSYIRTVIVPFTPEGLEMPKNIDWSNKTYTMDESKDNSIWMWIKEGDENLLKREFEGIIYKVDKNRGLLKEVLTEDYAVNYLKEKGEWDENAEYLCTISSLSLKEHIDTMAMFAKYVDAAISKTINLPAEYSYEDFKNVYLNAHATNVIKGVTTYRAGTMASVLADASKKDSYNEEQIITSIAPSRPRKLPCDIKHVKAVGQEWVVLVGLLGKKPYEVFAFKKVKIKIPTKSSEGFLTKIKSRHYNLEIDGFEFDDVGTLFEQDEQEALTRMISTALRHGADIKHVVEQLNKSEGTVVSFAKAIARTLKAYLGEDEVLQGNVCPNCGGREYIKIEGCYKCKNCQQGGCG